MNAPQYTILIPINPPSASKTGRPSPVRLELAPLFDVFAGDAAVAVVGKPISPPKGSVGVVAVAVAVAVGLADEGAVSVWDADDRAAPLGVAVTLASVDAGSPFDPAAVVLLSVPFGVP